MSDFFKITITSALMTASLCTIVPHLWASEIQVSRFNAEGLSGWETKVFKGKTEYLIQHENGRAVVRAVSHASASGMIRKLHFEPSKYRHLRWSWKVSHSVRGLDEKVKSGDDYAARVYVIFPGRFFWQMKAISYVWANKLSKEEYFSSPYSANAKVIVVESGNAKAGQWQIEERDLFADYQRLFGTEPPAAEAVAFMTDTDNTGGNAEAWYGDITLSTASR